MKKHNSRKNNQQINLEKLKGKEVSISFDGGKITSNSGIILLSELDKKLKITEQFSNCFQDYRHPSYTDYSVHNLRFTKSLWNNIGL